MRTIAGADCELSPKATTTSNPLVVCEDDESSLDIDSGYREHYDRSMTSLKYLADHIDDSLEASYRVTNAIDPGTEESRTDPKLAIAYDAQTVLTLLKYALEHPDQEDLSPNFGPITKDALQDLLRRITLSEDREFEQRLREIVDTITLPEQFAVIIDRDKEIPNGRFYFQIRCWRMDVITRTMGYGFGGKAYLSPHQTDNELVQTIFGLYKGYWEHEARESFEYKERRVFGPHISTEALHSIARKVDVRSARHIEDSK